MKYHSLQLIPSAEDMVAITIANHLRMLAIKVDCYVDFYRDEEVDVDVPEHIVLEKQHCEEEMIKTIAICLHLVNELLLATMLVKICHLSENSAYEYIGQAKEIMDKHYPV